MFHCQRSSYDKEYESTVVSCTPASRKKEQNGKKVDVKGFEVIFEDTVFFPEGGGQNTDLGVVGEDNQVLEVTRRGDLAVHFLTGALEPGQKVSQKINWDRRFDNMQQHSGQHLVSAILEKDYNINTMSWWMAESSPSKVGVSYIEVDKPITAEVMTLVEDKCNESIRDSIPVTVSLFQRGDPELEEAHTRGLPDDFTGPIRLIRIGNLDNNLCCGTHVANLAHLQAVKLMYTENKKGKQLLYFLVGSRVLKYLSQTVTRERLLTDTLRNGPDAHVDLVDKMQKTLKVSTKTNSNLLKEIALSEAKEKKLLEPKPSYAYFYRREGDNDYISVLTKELTDYLLIVIVGEGTSGQLVISGQGEVVVNLGKKLCELLEGKGGGKGSRFNAKISSFKSLSKVEETIQSFIAPTS
eukprot:TRINITY_DN2310_c0_g1_i4.p1 TRINITY_DN2310_c0_g1~~TRINITY_DN2310_c0_g1_i4.p1  ORF type:complete len:420 (-),score=85.59 TRINITY_DN2310_c0_g1_i4:487-1716(-)